MKVLHEWLEEYMHESLPDAETLAELLTFHAFEIEEVNPEGVIDVDVLPNRSSDCLSHRGIAREIATLTGKEMKDDPFMAEAPDTTPQSESMRAVVEDSELCPRFSLLVMKDVKVGPSPDWLQKRLEALGQRSINNIVDATNYVMLSLGQPLHAFDMDTLEEKDGMRTITVRRAKEGESITTLDEVERVLSEEHLLITDGVDGAPLSIAGIKGGLHSGVSEDTKNIVLEAGNFHYQNIRKTSQSLKLHTDASLRFQNEIVPQLTTYALDAVATLIEEIAGGTREGWVDECFSKEKKETPIKVSREEINGLLGTTLDGETIGDILKRLGFQYEEDDGVYEVAPSWMRTDIVIKEDVIEEIGRVYGYKNIQGKQLLPLEHSVEVHKGFYYTEKVRTALTAIGFDEVYTYTLQDSGEVELLNSLASDKSHMRVGLAEGMHKSLELNEKNAPLLGLDAIQIFEIGPVFKKDGEREELALGVRICKGKQSQGASLLERAVLALEEALGTEVHTTIKDGVCEIDFTALIASLPEPEAYEACEKKEVKKYTPISQYPYILRDIAVWTPEGTTEEEVLNHLLSQAGELLKTYKLFDVFEKDGRVSYAFNLVFQSHEKTLSDTEINEVMGQVTAKLESVEGYSVR